MDDGNTLHCCTLQIFKWDGDYDKTVDYRNKTSITGMKDADKDDDCRNEDMKR